MVHQIRHRPGSLCHPLSPAKRVVPPRPRWRSTSPANALSNGKQPPGTSAATKSVPSPLFWGDQDGKAPLNLTEPLPDNTVKKLVLLKPLLPQVMAPNGIHSLPRRKRKKALGFNRAEFLHKQAHTFFDQRGLLKQSYRFHQGRHNVQTSIYRRFFIATAPPPSPDITLLIAISPVKAIPCPVPYSLSPNGGRRFIAAARLSGGSRRPWRDQTPAGTPASTSERHHREAQVAADVSAAAFNGQCVRRGRRTPP